MKKSENQDPLKVVGLKFNFYRDGVGMSVAANLLLILLVIIQFWYIGRITSAPKPTSYVYVDSHGVVLPAKTMSTPYLSESDILAFATKTVARSYTFDAENYRERMSELSDSFTPEGHKGFLVSMEAQIKYVVENTLIASAVPSGTPVLIETAVVNGIFAWKVKVPVVVTYRTQGSSTSVKRIATLIIVNRPTYESKYGVGISSFIAKDV